MSKNIVSEKVTTRTKATTTKAKAARRKTTRTAARTAKAKPKKHLVLLCSSRGGVNHDELIVVEACWYPSLENLLENLEYPATVAPLLVRYFFGHLMWLQEEPSLKMAALVLKGKHKHLHVRIGDAKGRPIDGSKAEWTCSYKP